MLTTPRDQKPTGFRGRIMLDPLVGTGMSASGWHGNKSVYFF